ncbi:MAG: hypothetical protein FJ148_08705 [Deltaproteobacteria bacterium]|nr:hypothetical protein [Deltaproteobacteria bacterium]
MQTTAPIGRARRALVIVLAALVTLASAVDVIRDGDHWPFSSYSMFAELRAPEVRLKRVVGVRDGREVDLVVPVHLAPFHEARLMTAFRRLGRRDDAPRWRRAALAASLARYDALRAASAHDGPELDGLRFYELVWPLASGAANRDAPDTRRLIAEVSR